MKNPTTRNEWIFSQATGALDKSEIIRTLITRMLSRTIKMFKYENLPDTIPAKDLEIILQCGGSATIGRADDGKLYAFSAGLGGEPNPYYLPTIAVVANPALKLSKQWDIDKECVVVLNDYLYQGMMPIYNKYATLLAEAELSLRYAIINTRIPNIVQADNDATAESARIFFDKIYEGKDPGIITTSEFFDGIKTLDYSKDSPITSLVEATQYIRGQWYNEIGLSAQFNMKREAINEAEATMNDDILPPITDMLLECRQNGIDKVNEMFGTNITVSLDSIWADKSLEQELGIDMLEAEIKATESAPEPSESDTEGVTEDDQNEVN